MFSHFMFPQFSVLQSQIYTWQSSAVRLLRKYTYANIRLKKSNLLDSCCISTSQI